MDDELDIEKIKKEQTTNFLISANLDYEKISIQFFKKGILLTFSDENNVIFRGVAHKINEILLKRKSNTSRPLSVFIAPLIFISSFLILQIFTDNTNLGIIIFMLVPVSMIISEYFTDNKEAIIYLTDSKDQVSFFKQYRDQILVGFICAFGGGFLVFLISQLYNYIK